MIATDTRAYRLGEFHPFSARDRRFLYLVPAGAIFELDGAAELLLERLAEGEASEEQLVADLAAHGFPAADAQELISELYQSRVIVSENLPPEPLQEAPADFPLQTLVLNLTNQCNLSCQYCYEFGEDKVATPEGKPKFMDYETAQASVDFLLDQSVGRRTVHITFFGGETLMNFPLLKKVVTYATNAPRGRAGRSISA
ncbi:MAG TPA: radical SAM protein [Bryobacteraceae bacterium]|nr:radical SAM protein [Bryobacteraceae bacterium]